MTQLEIDMEMSALAREAQIGAERALQYRFALAAALLNIRRREVDQNWRRLCDAWRKANASWLHPNFQPHETTSPQNHKLETDARS